MTNAELGAMRVVELEQIASRDGVLTPAKVVEFATNPETALHSLFEWDDAKAGPKYREMQAQQYIRAVAVVVPDGSDEPRRVRAYVSLRRDREEGGYRSVQAVLADPELRKEMVADAMRDYQAFRTKWKHVQELAQFFDAADHAAMRLAS